MMKQHSLVMQLNKIGKYAFIISALFTIACNKKSETTAAATEVATELAVLTSEQIALAGIELGRPEKRVIADFIECNGRIEAPPYSLYSVFAPGAGFIQSAKWLPGDFVKKGAVLTSLRHPDFVKSQRELLEVQSQLSFLQNDLARKETLAAADAASQRALEQARADLRLQEARYKGLRAELELLGISVKTLEETGDIQSIIYLYAPVSGYITKVNINIGKLVSPADLLFEIVDRSHTHLELQVFAKDVGRIREGQRIECQMPGSDRLYAAEVHQVGKMIDPGTKTTMVHGHFEREPTELITGAYMQARIFTDAQEVWAVPLSAIIMENNEHYIFVKKPEGFTKTRIKTGRSDGNFIEIQPLSLAEREMIIIKGAYYVQGHMESREHDD